MPGIIKSWVCNGDLQGAHKEKTITYPPCTELPENNTGIEPSTVPQDA